MQELSLRDATETDFEGIQKVHLDSLRNICGPYYSQNEMDVWLGTLSPEKYAKDMKTGDFVVVVNNAEREIVAFGHIAEKKRVEFSEIVDYQLYKLYVSSKTVYKGIGKMIYNELERRVRAKGARAIGLLSSLNAISFYENLGFNTVGLTRALLSNIQCPIMEKVF